MSLDTVPYLRRLADFCTAKGLEEAAGWYAKAAEALLNRGRNL